MFNIWIPMHCLMSWYARRTRDDSEIEHWQATWKRWLSHTRKLRTNSKRWTWNVNMSKLWKRDSSKSILLIFPCLVYGMVFLPHTPCVTGISFLPKTFPSDEFVTHQPESPTKKNVHISARSLPSQIPRWRFTAFRSLRWKLVHEQLGLRKEDLGWVGG